MLTSTRDRAVRSSHSHLSTSLNQPPARTNNLTDDGDFRVNRRRLQIDAIERPAHASILPETLFRNQRDGETCADVEDGRRRAAVQVVHPVAQRAWYVKREDGRALGARGVNGRRDGRDVGVHDRVEILRDDQSSSQAQLLVLAAALGRA